VVPRNNNNVTTLTRPAAQGHTSPGGAQARRMLYSERHMRSALGADKQVKAPSPRGLMALPHGAAGSLDMRSPMPHDGSWRRQASPRASPPRLCTAVPLTVGPRSTAGGTARRGRHTPRHTTSTSTTAAAARLEVAAEAEHAMGILVSAVRQLEATGA
jgi:hypothetical protein